MKNNTLDLGKLLSLVKYPLLTEKCTNLYKDNQQYTFIVAKSLKKREIKYIIEKIFEVSVTDLNTIMLPLKKRRIGKFVGKKSRYKKVYLKLKKGDTIKDILL